MTYWLFDIDGTLVDSTPAVERAWRTWAAELLASLPRDRWAAVTSGGRELMSARLAAAGLPVPDVLVTAEDVDVGKPDPAGYLLAARRLGADPAECIVVEDAPAGLEAGRRAGCRVIAVATSHSPGQLAGYEVLPDLTCLHIPT